jgi:hypothetical protein
MCLNYFQNLTPIYLENLTVVLMTSYQLLHDREKQRREAFLDAVSHLGYSDDESVDDNINAFDASEVAWEHVSRLTFSDGSSLGGETIRFANETGPASHEVRGEIRDIIERIDNRIFATDEVKDDYIDPETYREQLRNKYEAEAMRYRLELEELAGNDSAKEPIPVIVESLENPPSQKVLNEIGEIMFRIDMKEIEEEEIDLVFMESLALSALAKQKKSR